MYYIGIDGGLSGGISVFNGRKLISTQPMPTVPVQAGKNEYDYHAIHELLMQYPSAIVIFEKAQPTPKLGVQSAFKFGLCYGAMIGLLTATKHRYHIVHAKTWQGFMFRDQVHSDTKSASKVVAARLFPEQSFTVGKSKKVHDGLTDSALIGYYGVLTF